VILVLSQLFIALAEPLLLTLIVKAIPSLFEGIKQINLTFDKYSFSINRDSFFKILFLFIVVKVLVSSIILYFQNFVSFYLAKNFSSRLLVSYHNRELDDLEEFSKTYLVRFILYEMETLAKSGFQNLFMLIAEFLIAISIIVIILIEFKQNILQLLILGLILGLIVLIYLQLVKSGAYRLGKKREFVDNQKLSFLNGLFQNFIAFKLFDRETIINNLNHLFTSGIKISAAQTTLEGSFKLLLEFVFFSSICAFFLLFSSNFKIGLSSESVILLIILLVRLIPSISRILAISSGFAYVKFITDKTLKELDK
jgi:hypothetical protein